MPSGIPFAALASASAIARSAPGSSTRTPPASDTKTSLEPSASPPWRESTARMSASRLRSTPFATRRGGTSSVGATSACTSTSSGRVPSIAARTTEPGARVASATKRADASATSARPSPRISKTPTSFVDPKRFLSARSVR